MSKTLEKVLDDVRKERAYQDSKWGGVSHDDTHTSYDWIAYIVRYTGRAVIWDPFDPFVYRESMIKVAALAVAAVEWLDRNLGQGSNIKRY